MKLFSFPLPKKEQSIFCYLRRLTQANHQPSVAFLKHKLLGNRNISSLDITACDMRSSLGGRAKHVKALTLLSTEKKSGWHQYGNLSIPSHQLHWDEMYCPNCFKEQGYMLSKWQIGWLPMCLKHERPLLEVCHEMAKQLINDNTSTYLAKERRHYDLFAYSKACENQQIFEDRLVKESQGNALGCSIVDDIDQFLMMSLNLNSKDQLLLRRRRYALRQYPLKDMDKIKFLDCIASQKAAA